MPVAQATGILFCLLRPPRADTNNRGTTTGAIRKRQANPQNRNKFGSLLSNARTGPYNKDIERSLYIPKK